MSVAILVVVASLAITATQSPPPAIAELAPSAVQQIKDAPSEQTSTAGEGDGGGGGGLGATTTTTAFGATLPPGVTSTTKPPPIERARVRRCVGNPPRQTEDPQSPPCVPYFQGDNGGSTYRGVTKDSITFAIPTLSTRVIDGLMAYFNKRYEFYGRKLVLVPGGGGETCQERKASAVEADEQLHVFGGLDATNGNAGPCFQAEIARRKLMSSNYSVTFNETDMQALAPYAWQYNMAFDRIMNAVGEFYCARLAGQNADYSKDPLLIGRPRKLGVIIQNVLRDTDLDTGPLDRALARCSIKVTRYERLSTNDDVGLTSPEKAEAAMLRMKSDGVSTIVNLGIAFLSQYISGAASHQSYYPEWIWTSYGGFDSSLVAHTFWPDIQQRQSVIGFSVTAPQRTYEQEPAFWAFKEVDPTVDPGPDLSILQDFTQQYRALLPLVSGIQLAGPNLTPDAIGAVLKKTKFPYPPNEPSRAGDVGFTDGDHSMTDDVVEFWWSESSKGPYGYTADGATGSFCYLNDFRRIRPGSWPKGPAPFFQFPCVNHG